jgi:hypothetical protein
MAFTASLVLNACQGSNDSSGSKVEKARGKYEATVPKHGADFASKVGPAEVNALKELSPSASIHEVLDRTRAVSAQLHEEEGRTGETICQELASARESVGLKSIDSGEETYERSLVDRSVVGAVAESVFRSIKEDGGDARERYYALLGLGQTTDPASAYGQGVTAGVISADGLLTAASSEDAYDSFVAWLKNAPALSIALSVLSQGPTEAAKKCISAAFSTK